MSRCGCVCACSTAGRKQSGRQSEVRGHDRHEALLICPANLSMSQAQPASSSAPSPGDVGGGSVSGSEKMANNSGSAATAAAPTSASAPAAPKLRSCVVCRTRKVRCDKLSPCSNCRRANIPCVFPSTDRPPRWARRLERVANNAAINAQVSQASQASQGHDPGAAQVMERLRNLEGLVKELSSQLEHAHAAGASATASPPSNAPSDAGHQGVASAAATTTGIHRHFGRMVLQDSTSSRYVSSGFWSRVSDEVGRSASPRRGCLTGD